MNQTFDSQLLSRADLKDRAKGSLVGKYGKFILAFLVTSVITVAVQEFINLTASMLLSFWIILKELLVNHLTLDQIELLAQDEANLQGYMDWFIPIKYILITLSTVFTSVFKIGLALFSLNIACGQTARISDVFYGFRNQFGKSLKLAAIFVLIGQLIDIPATIGNYLDPNNPLPTEALIGLLLVLIAGVILYMILYLGISQTFFLALDFPGYSAKELIKLSIHIMKGHKRRFLLLELSFLPLILLSLLSFGIGNLWLNPYMQLTYTFFFLNLMQAREAAQTNT